MRANECKGEAVDLTVKFFSFPTISPFAEHAADVLANYVKHVKTLGREEALGFQKK